MVDVAGDHRAHYEAVAELRNLVVRSLRDHIWRVTENRIIGCENGFAENFGKRPSAELVLIPLWRFRISVLNTA